jgi:hypothetical protein
VEGWKRRCPELQWRFMKTRALFVFAVLSMDALCIAADAPKKYTGVITDDMCSGDHKDMGGTDAAKCTLECVKSMHAKYILKSGSKTWMLSDQKTPEQYAGKKVVVTGTVNGNQLQVASIAPAR